MVNRCDSIDALRYAYYEMMRIKEENQMLEKNKDYVEFTLQYTSVDWARSKDCPEVCLKGYSDFFFPGVPIMDVVCNEFDHKVVVVSKRDFEKMQADVNINAEIAKQWEINYDLLLKKIGFDTVEELVNYLNSEAECDTLHDAIHLMCKEMDRRQKKIDELRNEVKYTSEKWASTNSSNNSWKAAAECNSPKELIEKLNLLRDDISGRRTVIEHYKRDIEKWQKATGCISPKDISTSSLIAKTTQLDQEVKILNGALQEWREGTGCPGPIAAKALIESGMSYEYEYHEAQKENWKLTEEVDSWKNVTGYSTPEDYMHARISGAFHIPFDYTAAWQKATGCDTPEAAKKRISGLISEAEAWESDYNHLLALTGFDNEGEIEDFLEQNNDRNKLTTVIDNLKLENETMKSALGASNLAMQKELESNIDEWQKATGRISPEAAKRYIDRLKGRLNKIHGYSVDW